jgi:hypothetical protein
MNVENIVYDAAYLKVKDDVLGLYVHMGAYVAAMRLEDSVMACLRPGMQTWLTGHSLGGAAATILFLHLYERNAAQLAPLITFGQLRALECSGVSKYRCLPVIRFANWNDPAPRLPPSTETCGNVMDPGCQGTYAQLGDEISMGVPGATWQYATDQCALGNLDSRILDVLRQAARFSADDSAAVESLRRDVVMHLPDMYYHKLRDHVAALVPGVAPWQLKACCPAGARRCGGP